MKNPLAPQNPTPPTPPPPFIVEQLLRPVESVPADKPVAPQPERVGQVKMIVRRFYRSA